MSDMDLDRELRCKIADLTDECKTLRYELTRAIAQRDDEGDRLDWLMVKLGGNVTRALWANWRTRATLPSSGRGLMTCEESAGSACDEWRMGASAACARHRARTAGLRCMTCRKGPNA